MIEEPPLLTIKRRTRRPTAAQIDALRNTPTGFLTDAMGGMGALAPNIAPLALDVLPFRICGPALTCNPGPADILALLAALSEIQPGDVLVSATGNWKGCAAAGDRVLGMAKNSGASAFVTDGVVRDLDGIVEVGLPVSCAGLSPNSPFAKGPGTVGLAVQIGGLTVETGDMLVGDRDGIVVVPFERLEEVITKLDSIRILEADLDGQVHEGLKIPSAIEDLLKSDNVKYL